MEEPVLSGSVLSLFGGGNGTLPIVPAIQYLVDTLISSAGMTLPIILSA